MKKLLKPLRMIVTILMLAVFILLALTNAAVQDKGVLYILAFIFALDVCFYATDNLHS